MSECNGSNQVETNTKECMQQKPITQGFTKGYYISN